MSVSAKMTEIAAMSVEDRLALIEAIWDSLDAEAGQAELSAAQKLELARRLADHRANPDKLVPWGQIKAEALARGRE